MTEMHASPAREPWPAMLRRHPSAFLLAAQLVSLLLYPLLDDSHTGRVLFSALGALFLLLALWVVNRSPAVNWVAWLLAIPALGLSLAYVLLDRPMLLVAASSFEALVYFYTAIGLIAYMLDDARVTTDELFAAGATFTLVAWGFAYVFYVCQALYPGSFTGAVEPGRDRTWMELLFLSFTNLSGTGLGDVVPLQPQARVLVMLEQFCGIGYLAVVVSRLIGLSLRAHER